MQRRFALLLVLIAAATLLGVSKPSASAYRTIAYLPDAPPAPMPENSAQLVFCGPPGMCVRWDVTAPGLFDSDPLICPGRYNFPQGFMYRLMLSHIPGHGGQDLFSLLQIAGPIPNTTQYLQTNAVPVSIDDGDIDRAVGGDVVVKVVYVPDEEKAIEPGRKGTETLTSTRLDLGLDPIIEADRRGTILVILRIGADCRACVPSSLLPFLNQGTGLMPPYWPACPSPPAARCRP